MPQHFKTGTVRLDQVTNDFDLPVSEAFAQAFMTYMEDPAPFERRTVPARSIVIPKGFEAKPEPIAVMRPGFEQLRRTSEEMMYEIAVLEREDGALVAYDDSTKLALYRELAPAAKVLCVIIGKEPVSAS